MSLTMIALRAGKRVLLGADHQAVFLRLAAVTANMSASATPSHSSVATATTGTQSIPGMRLALKPFPGPCALIPTILISPSTNGFISASDERSVWINDVPRLSLDISCWSPALHM